MTDLNTLKGCELHVHLGGCIYAEDLLELGRDVYKDVDWGLFVNAYEKAYCVRPDPVGLFRDALAGGEEAFERLRRHYVFEAGDGTDFACFQAKFNMLICLHRHLGRVLQHEEKQVLLQRILERHRSEGLDYVEYRAMLVNAGDDAEAFVNFHRLNAATIQAFNRDGFTARYIISLPRRAPLEAYALVQRLFDERPDLVSTVVGLDFCYFEEGYPPSSLRPFFARLQRDNQARPERALEVVYHVGEVYFDKSLESAVRWCHEAAELGARRLGHATALGLDPAIAIARQPCAHEAEKASERLDQIDYDLRRADQLTSHGIVVDVDALRRERDQLAPLHPDIAIERPYAPERLREIRQRQSFVLDRLVELGVVIESCPASNLRIGGVPAPSYHPIHRFLDSRIGLVIGADDPGIFNSPLAAEVDWVAEHAGLETTALAQRLGDPRRFRLRRSG